MEHLDEIIGIIFIIIAIIFAVKFVVFLFTNYLISRILSIVISLAQIIMAFGISGKVDMLGDFMFSAIVLTALAWLFFIGPNVFDIEWDGSFDIRETFSGYRATPHMTGGFISNAIGALIISGIIYMVFGSEPAVFFVLPIILILINAVMIFKIFR